jgi:alpha-2-macroglobulin
MYSNESALRSTRGNVLVSWQFIVLQVLLLLGVAVYLEKPKGSLAGTIALQQQKFGLYSYDLTKNRAYVIAIGPRGTTSDERGVWVKPDGTFQINQLPVGEYQLKVRAPGFANEYVDNLIVDESAVTTVPHPIKMAILQPYIGVGANLRVFTSKEAPSFWVNGTGLKEANIRLFKKNILDFAKHSPGFSMGDDFRLIATHGKGFVDPFTKDIPTAQFSRPLVSDSDDSSTSYFKCDHPLAPGDYIIEAKGVPTNGASPPSEYGWFTVTDLGLIIKKAPNETVVRAIDLTTLKPVAGATINCGFTLAVPKVGKTGSDGFVHIPFTAAEQAQVGSSTLDVVGSFGPNRAFGDLSFYTSESDKYKTYCYTDRPVYRLGQTVYFKGLARERTIDGLKNPGANITLDMEVKDPDGNSMSTGEVTTNSHGAFHGLVQVPMDSKTGGYSINLTYPDGTTAYEYFEVAQYRKPEFQVEVTPITPRVIAGEKAKMKVHASYYFGGSVANARVKYSIYDATNWSLRYSLIKRPDYYNFFDDWEGSESSGGSYGGDFLKDGYVQLDANGDAIVDVDTLPEKIDPAKPYDSSYLDKNYKVDVEVTDISRMTVVGSGSLLATAGDFALFVKPQTNVAKVGDSIPVSVQALDYDGKPIANKEVTLKVARWPWNSAKHEYETRIFMAEQKVVTNAQGEAQADIPTKEQWPSDEFYISAEARDSKNNFIFDSNSMWVANWREPFVRYDADAESQVMSIKTDKEVYRVGDTAKIMITAPVTGKEGLEAIVSTEGPRIYNIKAVKMDSTAKLIEVPIKDEYAPNVYVSVALVDKHHKFYNEEKIIQVSPENNFLKIAIASDKQKYKPGETVKYTITAKHNDGTPAANTDLSLGVVDESIYAIRPETAEDIRKFFYVRRENEVHTASTFPEELSGGPDKAEPKMRKDFKDTAAWIPDIITDGNGVAVASIKLPDNLTTWRATVRGIDMKTGVGSETQKVISTQDLILRLALPRFFSQGDEGLVSAVVHNYSDVPQSVNLTVSMSSQFQTKVPLTQKLQIAPQKAERFSWPVSITGSGKGVIQCKAIGSTVSDAMETKLPIRPLGIPAFSAKSGVITDESKTIDFPVGLSSDAERSTAKYELSLASSSIGPVLGNFGALIDYPYGCTEQTMSKLVPSIVAKELQIKLHQPISKADSARFDVAYKQSIQKLLDYHHNDGGWGWWENDSSNVYLTSIVVDGLRMLKEVGYKPADDLVTNGRKWLRTNSVLLAKQLADPKLLKDDWNYRETKVDFARMLFTLSAWKEPIAPASKSVALKELNHSAPETLAYFALAFHQSNDDATAKIFYDRLIQMANTTTEFVNWKHNHNLYKKLGLKDDEDYTYRFTSVESTALALKAVLAMEPKNFDRIEAIKKWILLQRSKDGWDNTKTTAEVFLVLMQDELQSRDLLGKGNFTSRVSFDQKVLADFISNQDNLYASQKTVQVPIPEKRGTLTISKDGPGRLYYNALVTYFRKLKPGDQSVEKGLPQGLKITRKFYRLVPGATASNGGVHFHTKEITDGMIKAGETVMMKTFVESPVSLPYIMVQAALPSGAEVVDTNGDQENNTDTSTDSDQPGIDGDWGAAWWTHQDILDDRIVYFGTRLPQGKSEFHTMIRLELPGNIQVNPVSLEGMYTNAVRGYSGLDSLHIND